MRFYKLHFGSCKISSPTHFFRRRPLYSSYRMNINSNIFKQSNTIITLNKDIVFFLYNIVALNDTDVQNSILEYTPFYKQRFFQLSLSIAKLFMNQMLLRCCLIYISIIILMHFLHLLYLCPCLDLGLFMSYLCDLFLDDNVDEECQ